jgi:hypothetical protein
MSNDFKGRLAAAEKAYAAKYRTGRLLVYNDERDDEPVLLHQSEVEAITAAKAAGKNVFVYDEDSPPSGVITG